MSTSKQNRLSFLRLGQSVLATLVAIALVGILLFYHLGNFVPHFSTPEINTIHASQHLTSIRDNPINAPYKLALWTVLRLHYSNPFILRSVSAIFGALAILLFYRLLRHWCTFRLSIVGTMLFATSSWFLFTARLASTGILFITGLVGLMVYHTWLAHTKKRTSFIFLGGAVLCTVLLYIPGLVWFVLLWAIGQHKLLGHKLRLQSPFLFLPAFILIATFLLPLLIAVVQHPSLIKPLLGLPDKVITLSTVGHDALQIPTQLIVKGPLNPIFNLGRLPILDLFILAMLALGTYAYYFQWKQERTKLLLATIILSLLLISLGGPITIIILLPLIYIVAAQGVTLMLQQWLTVFPRNPLARGLGVSLLVLVVLVACSYNLDRYFIAWRLAPATKQAFTKQL